MTNEITSTATFVCDGSTQGTTLFYSEHKDCFFAIEHGSADEVSRHEELAAVRCSWDDLDTTRWVAGDSEANICYLDTKGMALPGDLPDGAEVLWTSREAL